MTAPRAFVASRVLPGLLSRQNPLLAFLQWWPLVTRGTLKIDLTAGITGALVVLPQGVAFATLAGMPPEYGLYAGMVPTIVAALFGSSWQLVSGPTTAASLIVFASMTAFAEPGSPEFVSLVLTLTFMVGAIELVMGVMRLGALVNYISQTVAIAFISGAAILIAVNQLDNLIGVHVPRGRHFYDTLASVYHALPAFSPAAATVGISAILFGVLSKRFFPRFPSMVTSLIGSCVLATVLNEYFDAEIETISAIPASLPPLTVPDLSLDVVRRLAATAVAVTIFALPATMSTARSIGVKTGQQVDGNQEFIGQGLSNLIGCFFGGFVSTGSFNRSGLNFDSGAKTPIAAISAGVFLIGVVIVVAPLAVYLPKAGMAGILMIVAWNLIDVEHIMLAVRSGRSEAAVLIVTLLAVLFLDLELAVFAGVMLSLMFYLNRASHPSVTAMAPVNVEGRRRFRALADQPECPQLKVIRIEGALYFGAVQNVLQDLHRMEKRSPGQRHLLILADSVEFIDITGAATLAQEAEDLRKAGGALYLVGLRDSVRKQFKKTGYLEVIGESNVFHSKTAAFAAIFGRLDAERCAICTARVFWECRTVSDTIPAQTPSTYRPPTPAPVADPVSDAPPRPAGVRRRKEPKKVLALVDLSHHPRETVEMAAKFAAEHGSELAVGGIIGWDVSKRGGLALNLVSDSLVSSLRLPAHARLQGLARAAGFDDAPSLIANKQDPWEATLEMATDWHPDVIFVCERSAFDPSVKRHISYRTPSGISEAEVRRYRPGRKKNGRNGR
jgi:SulP family sulfate permease